MKYTIYKITNKLDGKIYIGKHQTRNLADSYMGSGKHLNHAKEKHGLENFTKEILFIFDTEVEMNVKEAELVNEEFCLREDTYNICPGGHGGWGYNNSIKTPEERTRVGFLGGFANPTEYIIKRCKEGGLIGFANNNKIVNEKRKLGIIPYAFEGKKHSNETKRKMSLSQQGKQSGSKNSQFGTIWITNGVENKKIKNVDFVPEGWYKGRKKRVK